MLSFIVHSFSAGSANNLSLVSLEAVSLPLNIVASARQNLQNGLCAQQRHRSIWAFAQSDQSSLCAQWVATDSSFLHADSEDPDQTGQMPRLICIFAGCTCHSVSFVICWLILV